MEAKRFAAVSAGLLLTGVLATSANAQKPAGGWAFSGSLRVRQEAWDWFAPAASGFQPSYSFTGSTLRVAGARKLAFRGRSGDSLVELALPALWNLPRRAVAPAPQGALGLGGLYRANNGAQNGRLFVKQAFVRVAGLAGAGSVVRAGRFDFADGRETVPADPALAWVKGQRVAERLIGGFGWTHVGRSFDGLQGSWNLPGGNLTAVLAYPTRGVFDLDGQDTITGVRFLYVGATRPGAARDARLFGILYEDARRVARVDNAAGSKTDGKIRLATLGGHYLLAADVPGFGKVDGLAWAAVQTGDWGTQDARGLAWAIEGGVRPRGAPANLWVRAGCNVASGDSNPGDGTHGTFYPLLNTPRFFARTPFYTGANALDRFVQAIVRPGPALTLRLDFHRIGLAQKNDLWYVAGGPFEKGGSFGLVGRPGGGAGSLADLIDLSADYTLSKSQSVSAYLGKMIGQGVVHRIYPDRNGLLGYLEWNCRW